MTKIQYICIDKCRLREMKPEIMVVTEINPKHSRYEMDHADYIVVYLGFLNIDILCADRD